MELTHKTLTLADAKMSDNGAGTIEGYAARYGNVDHGQDIIKPNSARNIGQFIKTGTVTIGHDYYKQGVATIKSAVEDETGLYVTAEWHTDQDSQKARTIVKERLERDKAVGLSIGFRLLKASYGDYDGKEVRFIEEYEPAEFALTDFPMNPLAGATMAKSNQPLADHINQTLAVVDDVTTRCEEVKALREKDGRDLGSETKANVETMLAQLVSLGERLHELVKGDEPEPGVDYDLEFSLIEADFMALEMGRNKTE